MKKLFLLISLLLIVPSAFSQNLNIYNQISIGGTGEDILILTEIPNSSSKLLVGSSNSNISGNKTENSRGMDDVWIVKTDSDFNILWDKTIGGSNSDFPLYRMLEDDKLFVLATSSSPASGEKTMDIFGAYDIWLLCLDTAGTILWQAGYGGSQTDIPNNMISYTDTSLLIVATSNSGISGNKTIASNGGNDFWVLEVSKSNGAIIQQKVFGSASEDENPFVAYCAANNNYYILGTSYQGISGDKTDIGYGSSDLWMLQLDANLNLIQDKCFGGSSAENSRGSIYIDDDKLYFSGGSRSPISGNKSEGTYTLTGGTANDLWQLKTDVDLNIIWDKVYGGTGDEIGSSVFKNVNGNLVVSTQSKSLVSGNKTSPRFGLSYDLWLLILDDNGNILAQESYGGTNDDGGGVIAKSNPNSILYLSGNSASGADGNKTVPTWGGTDAWIATIDASDFLSVDKLSNDNSSVAAYPNPFDSEVNFKFRNISETLTISFYSIDGRLIDSKTIDPSNASLFTWSNSSEEAVIVYSINGKSIHYHGKLLR